MLQKSQQNKKVQLDQNTARLFYDSVANYAYNKWKTPP